MCVYSPKAELRMRRITRAIETGKPALKSPGTPKLRRPAARQSLKQMCHCDLCHVL